jgi:TolB-like protein/tetratricopeptide (TPR) repeat protein
MVWQHYIRPPFEPAYVEKMAFPLPDKPSIAVLPFTNLSDNPEQAYFADGMTEDLITDLSKVAGLFVIARNSTFVYKGKAKDIREVARTLGVRYVLEGSVRRSGAEVRVNAQLIDAATGGNVWADRYDGELKNIFDFQDKVTLNVVTALAVELTKDDRERVTRRGTGNPQAYDVFLKGWQHYLRQTPEDFRAAIVQFKKAVELDPEYGRAYAALAVTYWEAYTRYWDVALGFRRTHEARFQADQFLAKAMRDPTPLTHQVASAMLLHTHQHDEAIAEARRAIAGDPNDADGYVALANVLSFTGRASEALEQVERAIRLNPHYPPYYLYQLGLAKFGMKRLDEAATSLERALTLNRDDYWSQRLLLATYGLLGRRTDAAKLLETIKGNEKSEWLAVLDPLTIRASTYWYPFAERADVERFAEGLRKAGVPE